jgi:3-oxoacyl-[acyl-carrier protein] reductase
MNVCLTARKQAGLDEARELLGDNDRILTVAGHAADEEHRAAAVAAAMRQFGRIDVLVNNTGVNPYHGPLMELDLAVALKTINTNVIAALGWSQAVSRAWMAKNGGSIVNVSSVGGLRASPMLGIYAVSKAALLHLTENMALEMAPRVRVNAIAPGLIKTDFAAALWANQEERVSALYPLRCLGTIEDAGIAIAFLASDDSRWITGQTIAVDGGILLTSVVDNQADSA